MPLRVDSPSEPTDAYKELPNGWVHTIGYPSKVGILEYKTVSGGIVREFRPPEELFSPETLESFRLLPLTLEHPPTYQLDADNTELYQIGHLGDSCVRKEDLLEVPLAVTARRGVEAIQDGIRELSAVCSCEIDNTPGVWQGQPYDRVQRKIRGNSVALTRKGRAGPSCAIRLDSAGELLPPEQGVADAAKDPGDKASSKSGAEAVPQVRLDSLLGMLDAERLAHQKAKQELVALKQEVETLKKLREDALAGAHVEEKVQARLLVIEQAKEIAPEFRYDSTKGSVKDIQIQAIAAAQPEFAKSLEGKSEEYISGVFETLRTSRMDSPTVRLEVSGNHFFSQSDAQKGIEQEPDYHAEFVKAAQEAVKKGV